MKFTVKTTDLRRALGTVQKVIKDKAPVAAAENVLCEVDEDGSRLLLTGTNLECTLKDSVPVTNLSGKNTGRFLVNPRYISDLLKEYSGEETSFETARNNTLLCTLAQGEYSLKYLDAADFPEPAATEGLPAIAVALKDLSDGLGQTVGICDDNGGQRPALEGVLFDIKAEGMSLVATDGCRLVMRDVRIPETLVEEEAALIVHGKSAAILKGLFDRKADENAVLSYSDKRLCVKSGSTTFITTLVAAKYPKYMDVFPQDNDIRLTFSRESLLNLIRRVSVCSSRENKFIRIDLSRDSMTVASEDTAYKISAKETVSCGYDGEPMTLGLNADRFTGLLNAMDGENVDLQLNANTRKAIILSAGAESSTRGLIMPVII